MEDAWRGVGSAPGGDFADFAPQVDISETEMEYRVTAELPGLEEKDFDVSLDGDLLTLKGEKKVEREEKGEGFSHVEISSGSFHRAFRLPVEVKADGVKAAFKNGVLTVTLPKADPARAREIPITAS
jgi:HSP20 family protein